MNCTPEINEQQRGIFAYTWPRYINYRYILYVIAMGSKHYEYQANGMPEWG